MLQVLVTRGLPASGKSTWAKEQVKKDGWKRVNRDDLRAMVDAGQWSAQNEKFIISLRNHIVTDALRKGFSVIIDDTNLPSRNFKDICKLVEGLGMEAVVSEKFFPIELDDAIERDAQRGPTSVGADVITDMYDKYLRNSDMMANVPRIKFFSPREAISSPSQDAALPKAIIVDLDGTLAIMGDRSPYDASNCHLVDEPHVPVVETVRLFWEAGYKIVFVSGREEKDRGPSLDFVAKVCPWLEVCELHMRRTGDSRADTIVKKEIWEASIKGKHNVLLAIDDRPCVVRMWRYEVGLPVYQVNDREF
jgi:predicted kinase